MDEARKRCWLVDVNGLIESSRTDLADFQKPFAHAHAPLKSFLAAVESIRPTGIIGVSTVPKLFDQSVIEAMARINERPIIFPYSNPTSRSECTAEEAYKWSQGRAIFASGSPFPPVQYGGKTFVPGQGNNVYIFPALGLAIYATQARRVTDEMFLCAATSVAEQVTQANLDMGLIYPPQSDILEHLDPCGHEGSGTHFRATTSPECPDRPASATSSARNCISPSTAAASEIAARPGPFNSHRKGEVPAEPAKDWRNGDRVMNTGTASGAAKLVRSLEAEGVEYIFCIPGAKVDKVLDCLIETRIKTVVCRHEQNAALIAQGIGRMTGKAGVCLVTSGPGCTNLTTGLATADYERDPVVALGGAVPLADRLKLAHQSLDTVSLFRPITRFAAEVTTEHGIPEVIAAAFRAASAGVRGRPSWPCRKT